MRTGWPLKYFKGETQNYVFPYSYKNKKGETIIEVEDYGDQYEDNASFIELIGKIIIRETGDKEYGIKIMKILAKKLKVPMRKKPLTTEQIFDEMEKLMKKFKKSKNYKEIDKILKSKKMKKR